MIVSHEHHFILLKPNRVASTTLEIALSKVCGPRDVITSKSQFDSRIDGQPYDLVHRNDKGLKAHLVPSQIRRKIGPKIWSSYMKAATVRNPWDHQVSLYWFFRSKFGRRGPKSFDEHLSNMKKIEPKKRRTNEMYYFNGSGKPILDFYIMFEHLEEGYVKFCEMIGVQPSLPLPEAKTKMRRNDRPYASYYKTKAQRDLVARWNRYTIRHFGYVFEG